LADKILQNTQFNNGEKNVRVESVLIHETRSSYAQCFRDDAYSEAFGLIDIKRVVFSDAIKAEWKNGKFLEKVL
jgi:6-pyruvoyltetrahydropterin/6-carboxytetrahydropterin synthase